MKRLPLICAMALLLLGSGCSKDWSYVKVEPLAKEGKVETLGNYKGKVVLLEFWATWCGPCRRMAYDVEDLYYKYKDKGLEVIAITDEERPLVKNFQASSDHKYPLYLDPERAANKEFDIKSLPTIILLDKNGHQILRFEGAPMPRQFEEAIKEAIK